MTVRKLRGSANSSQGRFSLAFGGEKRPGNEVGRGVEVEEEIPEFPLNIVCLFLSSSKTGMDYNSKGHDCRIKLDNNIALCCVRNSLGTIHLVFQWQTNDVD